MGGVSSKKGLCEARAGDLPRWEINFQAVGRNWRHALPRLLGLNDLNDSFSVLLKVKENLFELKWPDLCWDGIRIGRLVTDMFLKRPT